MATYYNPPTHGERTANGIWCDSRPISNWDDALNAAHTPDCDDVTCSYGFVENANSPNPVELTYNAEYGLWLCPTHWAELEAKAQPSTPSTTYEAPRLTPYGDLAALQGATEWKC